MYRLPDPTSLIKLLLLWEYISKELLLPNCALSPSVHLALLVNVEIPETYNLEVYTVQLTFTSPETSNLTV